MSDSAIHGMCGAIALRWWQVRLLYPVLVLVALVTGVTLSNADPALYERYATAALRAPLFHQLPKEYPALSLAVFLLPKALPFAYVVGFAMMAAVAVAVVLLATDGLAAFPGWSRRTCGYLLLGTFAVVLVRYDVFAVIAAVLAVEAARRERWGRAWVWAVVGGLLKLFPFLLLPGFFVVERAKTGRWQWKRVLVACTPVVLVGLAQLAVAPKSLLSPVRYEVGRGPELSSVQGSLTLLTDPLDVHWVHAFGSIEIVGNLPALVGGLVAVSGLVGLVVVWWAACRGWLSVEAVSLTVLSVAVLSDKAFAPQYLIWLVPFWAYWPVRRGWVGVAVLTTLIYPGLYLEAHFLGPGFYLPTAAAVLRNGLLIITTARWLTTQLQPTPPGAAGVTALRAMGGEAPSGLGAPMPLVIDRCNEPPMSRGPLAARDGRTGSVTAKLQGSRASEGVTSRLDERQTTATTVLRHAVLAGSDGKRPNDRKLGDEQS